MRCALDKQLLFGTTVAVSLALLSFAAAAEDDIMYKNVPSAEEVNNVLFGNGDGAVEGERTRSIRIVEPSARAIQTKTRANRMHEPENPIPADTGAQTVAATEDVALGETSGVGLGFNLQFAFNSVELLPESRPYIDRLGEVMGAAENQNKALLILGHTDATGPDAYNAALSENRAAAVKSYLTTTWNIPAEQLQIQGAGESQPLAGTDPNDGVNRRVEFFALN
jgi:outer membrane protein OmpA-like peptidoglycan-associated protein